MTNSIKGVAREGRPLPVFVLADTSSSMEGAPINALNTGLREMITTLQNIKDPRGEIQVCIITFGDTVDVKIPLMPIVDVKYDDFIADGLTPMGEAFTKVREIINDRNLVPSRSYKPTIALLTDGEPTDEDWEHNLNNLLNDDRAKKAIRFAMAFGDEANIDTLKKFIANKEMPIFRSNEPEKIVNYLKWVSLSVQTRSQSNNPDQTNEKTEILDLDPEDLIFD